MSAPQSQAEFIAEVERRLGSNTVTEQMLTCNLDTVSRLLRIIKRLRGVAVLADMIYADRVKAALDYNGEEP